MGNSSIKVRDFLKMKSHPVITIGPNETVEAAIKKLIDNNIGALPVCDTKGAVVGIISERDLLKECLQMSKTIQGTMVKDVMTEDVVIGLAEDDLDYIMNVMTVRGIRHIPVMAGPKLEGMVSMRDIVHLLLEQSRAEVRFLSDYISGGHI